MGVPKLVVALALVSCAVLGPSAARAQAPGWADLDLGASGGHAIRYLPTSVRPCDPLPLMLFLHGAGGTPEAYESYLQPDAEALGVYLVLPQASGAGWSGADVPTINAALDAAAAEVNVDTTRTYFAGHSAGAAFAYLAAYGSTGVAGVFTLSAPYYMVGSVVDTTYRAPIHMYYGADDPNYTMGAASALEMQWMRLGVTYETDVQTGYGHSTWPDSSMRAGFDFLLAHAYPGTPPASRCAGVDAGPGGSDAGPAPPNDGGAPPPPVDAGPVSPQDAASPPTDAGAPRHGSLSSGCGCRVTPVRGSSPHGLLLLLVGMVAIGRRRRRL